MAYEVLARKYRSRNFDEIVGQSAIATTLRNAVSAGRIHHGYLFTGTRGVGKTSMARILAKALNCFKAEAPTPSPCGECESCQRIAEGDDLDVVEIDAASNTGVDNIRDLRSNANYRPARSRFKVYIIDEVHMLSAGAFNALLKTLEEPPGHVKFILATTESQKVPATIQSRCQRFDFRSINPDDIAAQLNGILKNESITADPVVIRRVARLANGSMRDALSLLDQLLAYGADALTPELMEDLLPTAHDELILQFVEALSDADPARALNCVEKTLGSGYTPARFCDALIECFRTLMLLAVCGPDTELVDVAGAARERLVQQAGRIDAAGYVYRIALLEEIRRQVKSSSAPRPLIDAAAVRLALAASFCRIDDLLARIDGDAPAETAAPKKNIERPAVAAAAASQPVPTGRAASLAAGLAKSSLEPPAQTAEKAARPAPPRPQATSADRQRVMQSPLVRKVIEMTQGTLAEVRMASRQQPSDSESATQAGDEAVEAS